MTASREIHLAARPHGRPQPGDFALVEVDVPEPADGEVLIRNAFMSVDPSMRARMNDVKSYVPPFQVGEVMSGAAVGRVVASRNERFPEGSWVTSWLGWRELALSDGRQLVPIDPAVAPVSTALGVLGMPGLTAYVGLLDIGRPQEGETVYVSGAAGAVGSLAGQIAKLKGCRVIGSAGSAEKVAWLRELGFDEAFDYRETDPREALRGGIDLYFDNVGGATLEASLSALRTHGRVVACGADLAVQRDRGSAGTAEHVLRRDQAAADRGVHRPRPLRPAAGLPRGGRPLGARRDGALSRDRRRGDRERPGRAARTPRRRQHREDARQGWAGRMSWRCKIFGHKVPKAKWFFLTERFQRCERCGERVQSK